MTVTRVQFFDEPHVMQPGSVTQYLRDFASHLAAQGYQSLSISNYLWPALHFGGWIDANPIPLAAVTNETLIGFRDHYCRCPGHRKLKHVSRPYVARTRYFIEYLRGRNVIKTESVPSEPLPAGIVEFSDWLLQHRGSAAATIKQHHRMLRKILRVVGDDPITYDAATVRQAAIASTTGCGRPVAKKIITTFRMYLRFLSTTGKICPYLDRALPTVPQWKLSSLPRHMEPKFVPWLIASCDTDYPKGLRDRAVLLLLVRLGLRPGDIVTMRLDDIEWIHGTIRVRGKSRREVRLPLPQDAGDALLAYLEKGRPQIPINRVFLCAIAPFRPFQCASSMFPDDDVTRVNRSKVRNCFRVDRIASPAVRRNARYSVSSWARGPENTVLVITSPPARSLPAEDHRPAAWYRYRSSQGCGGLANPRCLSVSRHV